jgi:hypothetical protein
MAAIMVNELIFMRRFLTGTAQRLPRVYIPKYAMDIHIVFDELQTLGMHPVEVLRLVASADPARLML